MYSATNCSSKSSSKPVSNSSGSIPSYIREKAQEFANDQKGLAAYLGELVDNGAISEPQAQQLGYSILYGSGGSSTNSGSSLMDQNWTLQSKGGVNLYGLDRNGKVKYKDANGKEVVYRLDELYDALVAEGYNNETAKKYVMDLQNKLGISQATYDKKHLGWF